MADVSQLPADYASFQNNIDAAMAMVQEKCMQAVRHPQRFPISAFALSPFVSYALSDSSRFGVPPRIEAESNSSCSGAASIRDKQGGDTRNWFDQRWYG